MKVRSVLAEKGSEVHRVGPDASVVSAAHDLKRFGVGALVVCGAAGRIHGILTERDVDVIPRLGRAGPIPMGWSRPSRDFVGSRPQRQAPSLV
ncbi:MAG: CBS domain-containing protein [Acidimicrobiia bacterium]